MAIVRYRVSDPATGAETPIDVEVTAAQAREIREVLRESRRIELGARRETPLSQFRARPRDGARAGADPGCIADPRP